MDKIAIGSVPNIRPPSPLDAALRPLRPDDLEPIIALDSGAAGLARRGYFEKRLAAALRKPKGHFQVALTSGQVLVGFLLARVAGGEYGRPEDVVVLESLGVDSRARHSGLGRRMLAELERLARERGIHQLVTQVDWRNDAMLKFLAGAGFELAPRLMLERRVDRIPLPGSDEEIEAWPPLIRNLRAGDLDALVAIDERNTGHRRRAYLERKFDEALNDSAIEMSLVGEADGNPAAFAMARVDFGDFGHVDPVAALDTLGVDPGYTRRGLGKALLSQMVENLAALHVKRLETEVARDSFPLLQFLYDFGFGPSQRLSFERKV